MCDGNRRWAREAGFTDVASGHRAGALKIVEMLEWCSEIDGIYCVTLYLLSAENLGRAADELNELLAIIRDVVEEIAGEVPGHAGQAGARLGVAIAAGHRRPRR